MASLNKILRFWQLFRTAFAYFMMLLYFLSAVPILFLTTLIDRSGEWHHLVARLWGKWSLFWSGVDVRVKGGEHIQQNRPQVLMANHQSYYDVLALLGYIPSRFTWIAKKELFRIPIFGFVMKRAKYIEVDRKNHARAIAGMELASQQIREGTSVMIFPEGTRSSDGNLLSFKKGGIMLALKAGVPIIPIGISGSREILPRDSLRLTPGTIRLVIGPPINPCNYTVGRRDELLEHVRNAIADCIEKARPDETLKS